jgi:hypothetical protein
MSFTAHWKSRRAEVETGVASSQKGWLSTARKKGGPSILVYEHGFIPLTVLLLIIFFSRAHVFCRRARVYCTPSHIPPQRWHIHLSLYCRHTYSYKFLANKKLRICNFELQNYIFTLDTGKNCDCGHAGTLFKNPLT